MLRLLMLLCATGAFAQEVHKNQQFYVGGCYGFGNEFGNSNYSFSNSYVQIQFYYSFNPSKKWEYLVAFQPELNFAKHQLLNPYFVTPDEPDYEQKRREFTQLKDLNQYAFNVAFFAKYNFSKSISAYAMLNVGPTISTKETERLTRGFTFNDVLGVGVAYNTGSVIFDVRPNVRHVSNAGLNESNAGFNTLNISFGFIVPMG